jgi:hypothetical protein
MTVQPTAGQKFVQFVHSSIHRAARCVFNQNQEKVPELVSAGDFRLLQNPQSFIPVDTT